MYASPFPDSIVLLHGCNTTSAFIQMGKIKPKKQTKKRHRYASAFQDLGKHQEASVNLESDLENFTCLMYWGQQVTNTNYLRHAKFPEWLGTKPGSQLLSSCNRVDISLLPPYRDALFMHIERCNYHSFIWQRSHVGLQDSPTLAVMAGKLMKVSSM